MTTSQYPINANTPIDALDEYSAVLQSTVNANAAVFQDDPSMAADLETLAARRAAMAATHASWTTAFRVQGETRVQRDLTEEAARARYATLYKRAKLVQNTPNGEKLAIVLARCAAPSDLRARALADAMKYLHDGVCAHPDLHAPLRVTAAALASFEAQRQALLQAVDALTAAVAAVGETSALRAAARLALVEQVRLVEGNLRIDLPPTAVAGLKSARMRCLPRAAAGASEPAADAEGGDVEGDGDA